MHLSDRLHHPLAVDINYGYASNDNLLTKSDARGAVTMMTYDALNRPLTKSYNGVSTPTVTWTWDTVRGGSLSMVAVANGAMTSYSAFDTLGRVKTSMQLLTGYMCGVNPACTLQYTYNKAGGLKTQTYLSGRVVTYTPDAAGRVMTAASGSTTYASITAGSGVQGYAAHGAIQRLAFGNGLIEQTAFNNRLQPSSIQLGTMLSPSSISSLGLYYCAGQAVSCGDNNGSVQSMTISPLGMKQTFTYDSLDRIAGVTEAPTGGGANTWSQNFGDDRYGNMWVAASSGLNGNGLEPMTQNAYDPNNNRFLSGAYDQAGNQTFVSPFALTYDAENRVTAATSTSNGSTTYSYDGDGRRVLAVQSNGIYHLSLHDAMGKLAAEYTNETVAAGTQYMSVDHLGSTRVVTDTTSGFGVKRTDYLPYGGDLVQRMVANRTAGAGYGLGSTKLQFTGKERDSESGLDFFEARYMSSAQGRFTSPDTPLVDQHADDPQSWNLYSYGRNNPLRYTDPTGNCVVDGETHGWLWCGAHSIGLTQSVKEQADDARSSLSTMTGVTIGGKTPAEIAKNGTNEQVIGARKAADNFLLGVASESLSLCPKGVSCGVIPIGPGAEFEAAVEESGIVAQNGTRVVAFTEHGIQRVVGDAAKRAGTRPEAILDALKNPVKITKGVDGQGRPFEVFTGKNARVVVNPQTGSVVSVNPLSGAGAH